MSDKMKTVSVMIMGKEYLIACQEGEEKALLESALHLNERMLKMKESGRIIGTERIAVMVALNMTHELLQLQQKHREVELGFLNERMQELNQSVQQKLNELTGNSN